MNQAMNILVERFYKDTLISLASEYPAVRIVNSYDEEGIYYTVSHA